MQLMSNFFVTVTGEYNVSRVGRCYLYDSDTYR